MAAHIPALEPITIVAGDTVPWTKSLPDYLATDGWTLTYAFRLQRGSGKADVTATPDGAGFAVTITAAVSALMTPGIWEWAAYVTKATERYRVATGITRVLMNLAAVDFSIDLRSTAKQALDNAEAAWVTFSASKMVILNGRTYTARDAGDLIKYVDRCRADYQSELDKAQIAATGINPRHIGVRFERI